MRRAFGGYALVLAALALAGDSAEAVSPRHGHVTSRLRPSLQLFPPVVVRRQAVRVRVTGIDVPSLEVNVVGGTSVAGTPLRWKHLRFSNGAWRGPLPLPVRRGIYALELRVRAGGRVMASDQWFLRVFARGTRVEADVPGSARGRGVVGANDASWRRSRRVQALASLGRRHSRPAPTSEARDRIHTPGAPRRQRSTWGVHHCRAREPQRSVETARSKLGPIARLTGFGNGRYAECRRGTGS